LDEANINLLESEKDLFENSFKIDNSTFENYQKSRKNYVEGLMKRGYTEKGAEEAA
jgi:predicted Ser/Thr protein kinase